jgi:predicted nucleic acid-binding protein
MPHLLWDASALAKRYAPEIGSDSVDALFAEVPIAEMTITFLGYAETYSILLKKHNQKAISDATFLAAKSVLRAEVINSLDFGVLAIDTIAILNGIDMMEKHHINSSDAAILATYLDYVKTLLPAGTSSLLVATDHRLLRAAQAEGLLTLNPENVAAADIPALLASL